MIVAELLVGLGCCCFCCGGGSSLRTEENVRQEARTENLWKRCGEKRCRWFEEARLNIAMFIYLMMLSLSSLLVVLLVGGGGV